MNFLNKNYELIRQNEQSVKKTQKHDVNLQKNSTLYFQVGLILCLLTAYGLLEMKFLDTGTDFSETAFVDDISIEEPMTDYAIYQDPVEVKIVEPKAQPKYSNEIEVATNDADVIETAEKVFAEELPETNKVVKLKPSHVVVLDRPDIINIMLVEKVPVFPGCEKATSNQERRDCMSSKLTKFVQRKFNTDLGSRLGLSGKQKIYVNFKINKNGDVEILQTQAPHAKLKAEANRVVNKLPKMTPGKHGNKAVAVSYTLPIIFNIR